jgi:glycosyltransferase involved in cell wall biosynthesis
MKLSVLIRSLESRKDKLTELLNHLYKQATNEVEILFEIDNKEITSGAKANKLLSRAIGKYVVFIDDDDWVADYYVEEMLKACDSGADCFAINGFYSIDGGHQTKWRLSKDNTDRDTYENGELVYLRHTNHITAVKREIALVHGFPDKSNAEDKWYSERLKLETEYKIEPPMYWYRYSTRNKEYA